MPAWLRRLLGHRVERRAPMALAVVVYLVDQVEVHGQLIAVHDDALVVANASVARDGQPKQRPLTGAIRIATSRVDFYEVR